MISYIVPFELKAGLKRYLKDNNIYYEYYKEAILNEEDIRKTKEELSSLGFKGSFDKMSMVKTDISYDDYIKIIKKEINKINNLKHVINPECRGIVFLKR